MGRTWDRKMCFEFWGCLTASGVRFRTWAFWGIHLRRLRLAVHSEAWPQGGEQDSEFEYWFASSL